MDKKNYMKPTMEVVKLLHQAQLLCQSDKPEYGDDPTPKP